MKKYLLISLLLPALILPTAPDHGVLSGLPGQGVGGGADDHGLGNDDSPTFTGLTTDVLVVGSNAPATATSTGVEGTITWDSDYIYGAVATNTWKRVAWSAWGFTGDTMIYEDDNTMVFEDGDTMVYD